MAKEDVNFEWYVLNEERGKTPFDVYPYTGGKVKPFNIFRNYHVYKSTIELCEEFKETNMSLDDFTEKLRKNIMWQEWGRCEYEICVGTHFSDETKVIDCYQQILPNIKTLAKYVLQTYYPDLDMRSVK